MSHIVTVSPKGQITLPVSERKKLPFKQYLFERKGNAITLRPVEMKLVDGDVAHDTDFYKLSEKSLGFWNDPKEDIWDTFYNNIPSIKETLINKN